MSSKDTIRKRAERGQPLLRRQPKSYQPGRAQPDNGGRVARKSAARLASRQAGHVDQGPVNGMKCHMPGSQNRRNK